jgi:hypothetical protein
MVPPNSVAVPGVPEEEPHFDYKPVTDSPPPLPYEPRPPIPNRGPGWYTTNSVPDNPNRTVGPTDFGPSGFISPSGLFAYRIDFENETDAAAPAQQAVITNQLNANLD